jgi:hypothetical protein
MHIIFIEDRRFVRRIYGASRKNLRLKLNQQHFVERGGLAVKLSRNVFGHIRPQGSHLRLWQNVGKFAVSLFSISFTEAELFHPGE